MAEKTPEEWNELYDHLLECAWQLENELGSKIAPGHYGVTHFGGSVRRNRFMPNGAGCCVLGASLVGYTAKEVYWTPQGELQRMHGLTLAERVYVEAGFDGFNSTAHRESVAWSIGRGLRRQILDLGNAL